MARGHVLEMVEVVGHGVFSHRTVGLSMVCQLADPERNIVLWGQSKIGLFKINGLAPIRAERFQGGWQTLILRAVC
jgi:hypothetical protein